MILKLRLCFSLPALSTDPQSNEFAIAVAAWTEVLYGFVPIDKLEEAYLNAMRGRKSTFPLGVSEICAAYSSGEYTGPVAEDPEKRRIRESCQTCFGSNTIPGQPGSVCKHDGAVL